MNFVLFHAGNEMPPHIKDCIRQIQQTNPNQMIYLISNLNIECNDDYIETINANDLQIPDIGTYYAKDALRLLFRGSMLRIFYLEALIKKYELEHVIHFDNDVLIYENVDQFKDCFKKYNYCITSHNPLDFVYGFSYIKNADSMKTVNIDLQKLAIQGEESLKPIIKSMPHEMRLLKYVNDNHNQTLITPLPIMPTDSNFNEFGICFDPSSWGQYLGGAKPDPTHYIGEKILDKKIDVIFIDKKPKIVYNNQEYKLFNLHVHNKQLWNFR